MQSSYPEVLLLEGWGSPGGVAVGPFAFSGLLSEIPRRAWWWFSDARTYASSLGCISASFDTTGWWNVTSIGTDFLANRWTLTAVHLCDMPRLRELGDHAFAVQ